MAITNQDKKWRENMKRWKRGIALLAIVAMMMQVLPINVWAEPVADEVTDKTGYLPVGIEEVTLTEEDVADALTLEDQEYRAETYSAAADYSSRYYYNQLSYAKKTLYDSMYYECEEYLDTQDNAYAYNSTYARTAYIECTGMSKEDLWEVVWIFTLSNPQYFFVRGTAAMTGYQGSKQYVALPIYAEYQEGYVRASYTTKFNERINNWINEISAEPSDYLKIKKAHDITCSSIVYDNNNTNQEKHQSSATAVLTGTSVCAGYAQLFSLLCNAVGIPAICVTSPEHEWNEVKLDDNWYVVDCTWDDSNNNYYSFDNRHLYFGLTDELMAIAHPGHEKIYTADGYGTRSVSLADNYFVQNGEAAKWVENYRDRIQTQLEAKTTDFTISADNSSYPPSISGIQNGILAYAINQMDWFCNGSKTQLYATGKAAQLEFKAAYNENKPTGGHPQHVGGAGVVVKVPTRDSEGMIKSTRTQYQATKEETINKPAELISYRAHVQDIGWQEYVSDGEMSGTSGQSKRLEAINIRLSSVINGGVSYRTHIQDIGWQEYVSDDEMSGTSGQSKRLEAIQIKLTGQTADKYDIYYRVHCQDFGWLGWAKNGEASGSEGYAKRLEAIEIRLVLKGHAAPGNTDNCFYKR